MVVGRCSDCSVWRGSDRLRTWIYYNYLGPPFTGTHFCKRVKHCHWLVLWLCRGVWWRGYCSPTRRVCLVRMIRLDYAIQFTRRLSRFWGSQFTFFRGKNALLLWAKVTTLLAKEVIEPSLQPRHPLGFTAPMSLYLGKVGACIPHSICALWTRHFTRCHSECWRRGTSWCTSDIRIGSWPIDMQRLILLRRAKFNLWGIWWVNDYPSMYNCDTTYTGLT